jgi:hypothetical protein
MRSQHPTLAESRRNIIAVALALGAITTGAFLVIVVLK